MKNYLISIIIPMYNSEQYLDRCLKSVLSQSYKNIEVIIVDDGSIDNSLFIAKTYGQKDNRLKIFTKKNGGPSSSRNYGLNKVTGEYITFVDADDYLDSCMIEKMVNEIKNANDTMIFCGNYEVWRDVTDKRILFLENKEDTINKEIVMKEIASGRAGLVCCKLFSSNIINKFNIRFDENIKMCEDQIFFLEIAEHINKFKNINEALYYYDRRNDNSITIKYQVNAYENQRYIQSKIYKIFFENNLDNLENRKILKDRLRQGIWYCINNEFSESNPIRNSKKIKKSRDIIKNINIEDIFYDDNIKLSKIDKVIYWGVKYNQSMLASAILFSLVKIILPMKSKLRK